MAASGLPSGCSPVGAAQWTVCSLLKAPPILKKIPQTIMLILNCCRCCIISSIDQSDQLMSRFKQQPTCFKAYLICWSILSASFLIFSWQALIKSTSWKRKDTHRSGILQKSRERRFVKPSVLAKAQQRETNDNRELKALVIFWHLVTIPRHPCKFSSSSGEACPSLPPGHTQTSEEHLVYWKRKKILVLHLYAIACWELWFSFIFINRNVKLTWSLSDDSRATPDWDICISTHRSLKSYLFKPEPRQKFHHTLQGLINIAEA